MEHNSILLNNNVNINTIDNQNDISNKENKTLLSLKWNYLNTDLIPLVYQYFNTFELIIHLSHLNHRWTKAVYKKVSWKYKKLECNNKWPNTTSENVPEFLRDINLIVFRYISNLCKKQNSFNSPVFRPPLFTLVNELDVSYVSFYAILPLLSISELMINCQTFKLISMSNHWDSIFEFVSKWSGLKNLKLEFISEEGSVYTKVLLKNYPFSFRSLKTLTLNNFYFSNLELSLNSFPLLDSLNIGYNNLTDQNIKGLVESAQELGLLRSLSLEQSNGMTEKGMELIAAHLGSLLLHFSFVTRSDNFNSKVHICQSFNKMNKLTSLKYRNYNYDLGEEELIELTKLSKSLSSLDINFNLSISSSVFRCFLQSRLNLTSLIIDKINYSQLCQIECLVHLQQLKINYPMNCLNIYGQNLLKECLDEKGFFHFIKINSEEDRLLSLSLSSSGIRTFLIHNKENKIKKKRRLNDDSFVLINYSNFSDLFSVMDNKDENGKERVWYSTRDVLFKMLK